MERDHGGPAERLRLRRRGASARPRHVLRDPGRTDAWPRDARRQGRGLAHARRRLELDGPSQRAAAGERTPRRPAPGDGDRHAGRSGRLLRHEHGPGVRKRGRGRDVERDRELPALDLFRRRGGARLTWLTFGSPEPSPRSSRGCRAA